MVANELRINNYVRYKNSDYEDIPRKIKHTNYPNLLGLDRVSVNRIEYNHIKPIELSEKWLFDFGFSKEETTQFYQQYNKGNFEIFSDKGIFYYSNFNFRTKLLYVHQLQNLFFAITYNELLLSSC